MPETIIDGATEAEQWLARYGNYLDKVLGRAASTRTKYLYFANRLLEVVNQKRVVNWSALSADVIVEFVRQDAAGRKGIGAQPTLVAVRCFLRFLVSSGVISSELVGAVPKIRSWSQTALPQHLTETEIERLLSVSADHASKRNYAILLLVTRLGLRVEEAARVQLEDVDWVNGSLFIRSGKTRCERVLPLVQDAAESLLCYLQNDRPSTSHREIFVQHTAPFQPCTSAAIGKVVSRLFAKAGIHRHTRCGAHLLRHTVATQMVNHGVSFKDIADFLGHQSLRTTGVYARVDLATLSLIAMPWPGGEQ